MAKPFYWIIWVSGVQHRRDTRAGARIFAAAQKALGHKVIIKAVGF